MEYDAFTNNFATILDVLQIHMKELSNATNFDTSYLYRVRAGERRPNDLNAFVDSLCKFIIGKYSDTVSKEKIAALLDMETENLEDDVSYFNALKTLLYADSSKDYSAQMQTFLQTLDEFDLNDYIRSIHFDELKVPSMPFYHVSSKNYYGIEQMKKGELDFFKATVLSKSKEPIFMCSDMPLSDMAEDMDFSKKWMFAIAASLKKGLHLNIIHNIDRPFEEMMLGLEAWIPIYMTGQVSPYHLPNISTDIYHHFNYVSGAAALTGECIKGYHNDGKYYLTANKEEIAYFQKKAEHLLEKAKPLMSIYDVNSKKQFLNYENSLIKEKGNQYNKLYSLPLYSISKQLLNRILERHQIPDTVKQEIQDYVENKKKNVSLQLDTIQITDDIPYLTEDEFKKTPISLPLSGLFLETQITYSYEEYMEHLSKTKEFAKCHNHYHLNIIKDPCFHNIQIKILEGKQVLISKEKAPVIHFVIQHPKMVKALEDFIPPVVETE